MIVEKNWLGAAESPRPRSATRSENACITSGSCQTQRRRNPHSS